MVAGFILGVVIPKSNFPHTEEEPFTQKATFDDAQTCTVKAHIGFCRVNSGGSGIQAVVIFILGHLP